MRIDRERTVGYWSVIDKRFHVSIYAEYDNDGAMLHLEIQCYLDNGWQWRKTYLEAVTVRIKGVDRIVNDVIDLRSSGEEFFTPDVEAECQREWEREQATELV